ncbi:MAG: metal-dependent hydrolase [Epsilonproteobacteria bacterium]|nr:metal-dependent hydrolase [Campylobacterota bacterium]
MNFLTSDWIVTCDDKFTIIKNGAIVFDEKIIDIDTKENLEKKYPDSSFEYKGDGSVIMPGLINSHVHLEFSANKTTLKYGNFVEWLFSIIEHRDELIEKATKELIANELTKMIEAGTTTIGAVSSYGLDLEACLESKLNIVYFSEVLGSKSDMIDTLFSDFKQRLYLAQKKKSTRFFPAIAIHSPYSTHPFLIREVLKIAREENLPVSAHFMESRAENDWLNYSTGEFETFFKDMLNQHKSLQTPSEFLTAFKGIKHLSFTHCVEANEKEIAQIKDFGASIIHCPNSNRLLNNTVLNLGYLNDIPITLGTDGLSSNYTLDMFEEMKNGFFIHTNMDQSTLATQLILASTSNGAKSLGLENKGSLEIGKDSDLIIFKIPALEDKDDLPSAIILHKTKIDETYIKGQNELS